MIFRKACCILMASFFVAAQVMAVYALDSPGSLKQTTSYATKFSSQRVWKEKKQTRFHVDSLLRGGLSDSLGILCAQRGHRYISGGGTAAIDNIHKSKLLQVLKAPAVVFHLIFAICAVAGLALPIGKVGNRILILVIGYYVALVTVATKNGYREWLDIFQLLVPLSALVVFADWFQILYQDILVYPDTIGGPRIGPVAGFMAGLWTIALFPLMLLGRHVERSKGGDEQSKKEAGLAAVAVSSLVLFALAEGNSWRVPMWETKNCRQLGGRMAYFCVLAEIVLALATYAASFSTAGASFLAKSVAAFLLLFIYVGACAMFYMVIDILPDGVACRAFQK